MKYTRPKGTKDFLPKEAKTASFVEEKFKEQCRVFGFQEIRTPVLENRELFLRSTGEGTDIVRKEMYTFQDRGGRDIVLRPEGTPGVIRAILEGGMSPPLRLFYIGPMYRYEKPQKGRLREHHQLGVEVLGEKGPYVDAEIIYLAAKFFSAIGINDYQIKVNSLGCQKCAALFKNDLREFLSSRLPELCPDCQERFVKNPLRVFDCKNPVDQEIYSSSPKIGEYLCLDCQEHFAGFLKHIEIFGLKNYEVENRLVRGIDYYTRTVFEFVAHSLGAQNSFGGGGRYDNLFSELGGRDTPAVGFALGLERILLLLPEVEKKTDLVFFAFLSENAILWGKEIIEDLRGNKIPVIVGEVGEKLKTQLKRANSYNARFTIIIGEAELKSEVLAVKDMITGEQKEMRKEAVIPYLKQKMAY